MTHLQNKIDFLSIVTVEHANPNGDPLNGNRPRETDDGYGEISDVCLKRKIRNRLMDVGEHIFVQSDDKNEDKYRSLRERANANSAFKNANKDKDSAAKIACESWIDVRSFGQVFAFKGEGAKKGDGISIAIRGPVTIQSAFSINPVNIQSIQITKSTNSETTEEDKKSSDTMGMKHRIGYGAYIIKGSINVQLAEKTGFSETDADKIKEALRTLFINDSSSARPDGSMAVSKLYWWKHNSKLGQYSSAKVHNTVSISLKPAVEIPTSLDDYNIVINSLPDLEPEIHEGF